MLLGEMHDLARQIGERTVPWPLWLAAVRSAVSAAGAFDERLELAVEEEVTVLPAQAAIPMPGNYRTGNILAVLELNSAGERKKLARWRLSDGPPPQGAPKERTWDTIAMTAIRLMPSPEEETEFVLVLRPEYTDEAGEVPDFLLFGALHFLGKNLLQDARADDWLRQFHADMEAEVARGITANSGPLRIGG